MPSATGSAASERTPSAAVSTSITLRIPASEFAITRNSPTIAVDQAAIVDAKRDPPVLLVGGRPGRDRLGELAGALGVGCLEQAHLFRLAAPGHDDDRGLAAEPGLDVLREVGRRPARAGELGERDQAAARLLAEIGEPLGELGRLLVLVGVGIEVDVRVGECVRGDQLGGIVVRRTALAARHLAWQRRDRDEDEEGDRDAAEDGEHETLTGLHRKAAPELAEASADRPRDPPEHVEDVADRSSATLRRRLPIAEPTFFGREGRRAIRGVLLIASGRSRGSGGGAAGSRIAARIR